MKLSGRNEYAVSPGCATHVPANGVSAYDNIGEHKISNAVNLNTKIYLQQEMRAGSDI
jgi:hypothetical protein